MPFASELVPIDHDVLPAARDCAAAAEIAIAEHEAVGQEYAQLCGEEMDLEADRPAAKLAAIRRIMGTENTDMQKPHSASSAEKVVETDEEYRRYLKALSEVVVEKNIAFTHAQSARLKAELCIARFRAEANLR